MLNFSKVLWTSEILCLEFDYHQFSALHKDQTPNPKIQGLKWTKIDPNSRIRSNFKPRYFLPFLGISTIEHTVHVTRSFPQKKKGRKEKGHSYLHLLHFLLRECVVALTRARAVLHSIWQPRKIVKTNGHIPLKMRCISMTAMTSFIWGHISLGRKDAVLSMWK